MAMKLLTTNTSSNAASSSFTSSIDSTYKLYIFKFYDVNPATDGTNFGFQANVAGQSGYNETITSSFFRAYHQEDGSDAALAYLAGSDLAEGTSFQQLMYVIGSDADQSGAGELHLFNPSGTTYVKHFYSTTEYPTDGNYSTNSYIAGYFNVTGAIDEIQFKMASGNMDAVIKMYGVG